MAGVFVKFAIETSTEFLSVINESVELMQRLGDVNITKTRIDTVAVSFGTPCSDVEDLEEKSKELCDKLEPFAKDFQAFFQKESDKMYKCIFFVKTSDGDDPVMKIDKRLLKLAYMLEAEIHFDGFRWKNV